MDATSIMLAIRAVATLTDVVLDIATKVNAVAEGKPIDPVPLNELIGLRNELVELEDLTPKQSS